MKNKKLLTVAFIALFAAIICFSCFLRIPLGSVPVVLQNVLCVLTGALLGNILGGVPTALFLVAGLIGLPVYSGGTSGIAVWAGPTGGFLPGYLLGAITAGFIAGKPSVFEKKISRKKVLKISLAIFLGTIVIYIPGILYFAMWAKAAGKIHPEKTAFAFTMGACVLPYIPGDLIKTAVAIPVAVKVRPILAQYLFCKEEKVDKHKKHK